MPLLVLHSLREQHSCRAGVLARAAKQEPWSAFLPGRAVALPNERSSVGQQMDSAVLPKARSEEGAENSECLSDASVPFGPQKGLVLMLPVPWAWMQAFAQ